MPELLRRSQLTIPVYSCRRRFWRETMVPRHRRRELQLAENRLADSWAMRVAELRWRWDAIGDVEISLIQ
ncbi:hypothetical protein ACLK19_01765 [Escherichia coli]